MNLPYQRGDRFTADFNAQYRWYFEHAGENLADRFPEAVDTTLKLLVTHPELGTPKRFRNPKLAGLGRFVFNHHLTEFLYFIELCRIKFMPGD